MRFVIYHDLCKHSNNPEDEQVIEKAHWRHRFGHIINVDVSGESRASDAPVSGEISGIGVTSGSYLRYKDLLNFPDVLDIAFCKSPVSTSSRCRP